MSSQAQNTDIVEHFDKNRAAEYDKDIVSFIPGYDLIHESNLAMFREKNLAKANVLVVGAGTGKESISLASGFREVNVTAVDPSKAMLESLKSKVNDLKLVNIDFICDYVANLKGESFNFANSILVMHFLPDRGEKLDYLREIYKRLEPMSELILVDFMKIEDECQDRAIMQAMKNYQLSISPSPEKIEEAHEKIKTNLHRITESRLFDLAEKAGFFKPIKFFQSFLIGGYILRK
ncbi:MAG: class I SAM-dependent methyltransferase [Candidatus Caenarcaniphilales bacterium]|nr:class I SAM-dependent methyltransferase [Candidatus Caenarcaniphilales bacterium]